MENLGFLLYVLGYVLQKPDLCCNFFPSRNPQLFNAFKEYLYPVFALYDIVAAVSVSTRGSDHLSNCSGLNIFSFYFSDSEWETK